jgi:hypothetical protein
MANDCANALAHVRELSPSPAFLEFSRGWFAARELAGIEASGRALRRAAREPRFWRRKPKAPKLPGRSSDPAAGPVSPAPPAD